MATKKQHEAFNKKVEKLLQNIGASENTTYLKGMYKYQLDTKLGVQIISLSMPDKGSVFTVYSQFVEYDKYKQELKGIGCNHWKWNIHEYTAEQAINELMYRLEKVAPQIPVANS